MSNASAISGLSVLVYEENFIIADDIHRHLEALGARVVGPFSRLDEVRAALLVGKPDCAVVELVGQDPAVARLCRKHGVPLVLVSAYEQWTIPLDLSQAPFLNQPILWGKLPTAITAAAAAAPRS